MRSQSGAFLGTNYPKEVDICISVVLFVLIHDTCVVSILIIVPKFSMSCSTKLSGALCPSSRFRQFSSGGSDAAQTATSPGEAIENGTQRQKAMRVHCNHLSVISVRRRVTEVVGSRWGRLYSKKLV